MRGGLATLFQTDYLEYNLKGSKIKGMVVSSISNKYIYTKCGNKILRKGTLVQFKEKEESRKLIKYEPARHS